MSLRRNDTIVGSFGAGVFLVMMVAAFVGGADVIGPIVPPGDDDWWVDQPLVRGTETIPGELSVGQSQTVEVGSMDKVVRTLNATLTWSDEVDPPARRVRRHENQPDSFTLTIVSANRTVTGSGANPQGGEGRIEITLTFTDEELSSMEGVQDLSVAVKLDSAGIWLPVIGIGAIGLTDGGNTFDLLIEYDYYQKEPIEDNAQEGQG